MVEPLYRELTEEEIAHRETQIRTFNLSKKLKEELGEVTHLEIYYREWDPYPSVDLFRYTVLRRGQEDLYSILPAYEWMFLYDHLPKNEEKKAIWKRSMDKNKPKLYVETKNE